MKSQRRNQSQIKIIKQLKAFQMKIFEIFIYVRTFVARIDIYYLL